MGTNGNEFYRYFAKIKLSGIEEAFVFQISEDENERFKTRLQDSFRESMSKELKYFWFNTKEGFQGLIDITEVEFIHLLWERIQAEYKKNETTFLDQELKVYFKQNKIPHDFGIDDYAIGYEIAVTLDGGIFPEEMFFEFSDVDGESVFLHLNRIAAIFILDDVVDEGMKKVLPESV